MKNWHPIWYMRYLIEEFPVIIVGILSLLGVIVSLLTDIIVYCVQLLNVTIYEKILLLFTTKGKDESC